MQEPFPAHISESAELRELSNVVVADNPLYISADSVYKHNEE